MKRATPLSLLLLPALTMSAVAPPVLSAAEALAWRSEVVVPGAAAAYCPMKKLEAHFWDYLQNLKPPVDAGVWANLQPKQRVSLILEYCPRAEQIRADFVDVKVRLDGALRIVRGSATPRSEKIAAANAALADTVEKDRNVRDRLGIRSALVMVLSDTRSLLQLERTNLATIGAGEKVSRLQERADLAAARRLPAAGGNLGAAKAASDALFDADAGLARLPGAIDTRASAPAVRDVPSGQLERTPEQQQKAEAIQKSFKDSLGFGSFKRKEPPKPEVKRAKAAAGFDQAESDYIQKKRQESWFGPWGEFRAKQDVEAARNNIQWCQEEPGKCARSRSNCVKHPEPESCRVYRIREEMAR